MLIDGVVEPHVECRRRSSRWRSGRGNRRRRGLRGRGGRASSSARPAGAVKSIDGSGETERGGAGRGGVRAAGEVVSSPLASTALLTPKDLQLAVEGRAVFRGQHADAVRLAGRDGHREAVLVARRVDPAVDRRGRRRPSTVARRGRSARGPRAGRPRSGGRWPPTRRACRARPSAAPLTWNREVSASPTGVRATVAALGSGRVPPRNSRARGSPRLPPRG